MIRTNYNFVIQLYKIDYVLLQIETRGLTGLVKFDKDGFRSNIELDIVHLSENGLTKIAVWNSTSSGNIDWINAVNTNINVEKAENELSLQNQTFIVLISMTEPYGMHTESWTTLSGNERYEGFGVDIIDHISKILGFNYTLKIENVYGSLNEVTGKWSGMLGKIMADVSRNIK